MVFADRLPTNYTFTRTHPNSPLSNRSFMSLYNTSLIIFPEVPALQKIRLASYRVIRAHKKNDTAIYRVRIAIAYYVLQLAVNFLWPFVFFHYQAYWLAFALLIVLIYVVLRTYHAFSAIDRFAGYYLLPYLVWLAFAGYLNVGVAMLN
jgi:tryptophan-rich sensory protein